MVECSISEPGSRSGSDSGGSMRSLTPMPPASPASTKGLNLPRIPGHEVVGRIEALGPLCDWRTLQPPGSAQSDFPLMNRYQRRCLAAW